MATVKESRCKVKKGSNPSKKAKKKKPHGTPAEQDGMCALSAAAGSDVQLDVQAQEWCIATGRFVD
jgi:hypothetical protein